MELILKQRVCLNTLKSNQAEMLRTRKGQDTVPVFCATKELVLPFGAQMVLREMTWKLAKAVIKRVGIFAKN